MWLDEGEGRVLRHASTSVATPAAALAAEAGRQLKLERAPSLVLERGPDCLPGATLAHLRAKGWAVMRELIEPAHVAQLKAACDLATSPGYAGPAVVETSAEKHFVQNLLGQVRKTTLMNFLGQLINTFFRSQDAVVAKVSTHPVVLGLPAAFLSTSEKDTKLARKLGPLQLFIAVFPQECTDHTRIFWANLTPFSRQAISSTPTARTSRCSGHRTAASARGRAGTGL